MSAARVIAEAVRRHVITPGDDPLDDVADTVLIALYDAGWRVIREERRYCNRCGSAFPAEHKCGRDR